MGDYIVHRARFFNYQPKTVQSMSYDDTIKKLAISRFFYTVNLPSKSFYLVNLNEYFRSDNKIEIWCMKDEYLESVIRIYLFLQSLS